jgi:prepilin-type N-terminal cleavage/methylation domain-containing protein
MRPPPSLRRPASSGFTLIELLVVISIIAVLAGLLLPVISSVMQNAHKTEAKSTEMQIVAAVKNYYTEYGQYPVEPQSSPVDATFDNNSPSASSGKYGHNYILFNVLRASNSSTNSQAGGDPTYQALNSRQIVYFESKDVKNTSTARSGFIPVSPSPSPQANIKTLTLETGDLIDPWGNLYYVRIDGNYSGMVENPYDTGTTDASGTSISYQALTDPSPVTDYSTVVRTDVIAWSPGLDGCMGTKGGSPAIAPNSTGDDVLSWQ